MSPRLPLPIRDGYRKGKDPSPGTLRAGRHRLVGRYSYVCVLDDNTPHTAQCTCVVFERVSGRSRSIQGSLSLLIKVDMLFGEASKPRK